MSNDEQARRTEVREASELGYKHGQANIAERILMVAAEDYFHALGVGTHQRDRLFDAVRSAERTVIRINREWAEKEREREAGSEGEA